MSVFIRIFSADIGVLLLLVWSIYYIISHNKTVYSEKTERKKEPRQFSF